MSEHRYIEVICEGRAVGYVEGRYARGSEIRIMEMAPALSAIGMSPFSNTSLAIQTSTLSYRLKKRNHRISQFDIRQARYPVDMIERMPVPFGVCRVDVSLDSVSDSLFLSWPAIEVTIEEYEELFDCQAFVADDKSNLIDEVMFAQQTQMLFEGYGR